MTSLYIANLSYSSSLPSLCTLVSVIRHIWLEFSNLISMAAFVSELYSWGEPERAPHRREASLDCHFTQINDKKWTWCLISSCVTQKFSVVSEIYYIWSLDSQCHGKHVTKFSWIIIYGRLIVSVTESMWQSFPEWPYMVVGLSMSQK